MTPVPCRVTEDSLFLMVVGSEEVVLLAQNNWLMEASLPGAGFPVGSENRLANLGGRVCV